MIFGKLGMTKRKIIKLVDVGTETMLNIFNYEE
jgi:hypothetical protein